ncbi:hypothetical protein L3X38_017767 [Prunus dulcis]|uniref:Uncharacterized protein n=1 Tax=Prunus dulcis TaxID=3755 RepID=A0AAD4ZAD0_PRUDU|nr:hypothetical protein L3X38_017767 [Prunus dulcis]
MVAGYLARVGGSLRLAKILEGAVRQSRRVGVLARLGSLCRFGAAGFVLMDYSSSGLGKAAQQLEFGRWSCRSAEAGRRQSCRGVEQRSCRLVFAFQQETWRQLGFPAAGHFGKLGRSSARQLQQ